MHYDALINDHGLPHDPFKALVAPRPIGWISTVNAEGRANLAPYSFFNAIGDRPHYVMFASGGVKDSQRNAEATGEFVCNLATWDLRDAMNVSSAMVGADVDEFELAGLTKAPSVKVAPPRVGESPVALECRTHDTVLLPSGVEGESHYAVVIGLVLAIHIDDSLIVDGKVDITRARPIARLGYHDYSVVDAVFQMSRPQV